MAHQNWPLIYFVRHGQTDWNRASRFQGQRDVPLNDHGRNQAKLSGEILNELVTRDGGSPDQFDWFCSPLGRTRETMEIVRQQFDADLPEVTFDDRLREISFGHLEGILASDVQKDFPEEHEKRSQSKWLHRPKDGESYAEVIERVNEFMHEHITRPTVVVAHGGVARTFRHLVTGEPGDVLDKWAPSQEAVFRFENGQFTEYAA
ncbi:phosphoglycerate mutase (2,3-diphosphoglycerate-independent) [Maritalea myrionectae]|uniref:Phosphoglycerate mutase (2,3-diphosphoglycerate-independent) n=1 Tax=Maritalea myrionectae TaxID=454601 RepID=A0A2R4MGV2_9HYPH|nr:histidine phosphatase family protein [Maritalea myrionectae]AVX05195.1 phosphoglycerate mutase (2,3-diphosphoglycerate-independent) [Maritalea myrionectae]